MASDSILNIGGIRAVLKSGPIQAALASVCEPIADAATANAAANANLHTEGAVYKAYVDVAQFTAIGKVVCGNAAARHDNAHNNTLLKSR